MRFALSLALLFTSLSSLAWVELQLISNNYRVRATLTGDQGNPTTGTVVAKTQLNGECNGRFILDPRQGVLQVTLQNSAMPDNNCASESMTATIGPQGFALLMDGVEVKAIFRSVMFNNEPREAMVRAIAMGGPGPESL